MGTTPHPTIPPSLSSSEEVYKYIKEHSRMLDNYNELEVVGNEGRMEHSRMIYKVTNFNKNYSDGVEF